MNRGRLLIVLGAGVAFVGAICLRDRPAMQLPAAVTPEPTIAVTTKEARAIEATDVDGWEAALEAPLGDVQQNVGWPRMCRRDAGGEEVDLASIEQRKRLDGLGPLAAPGPYTPIPRLDRRLAAQPANLPLERRPVRLADAEPLPQVALEDALQKVLNQAPRLGTPER